MAASTLRASGARAVTRRGASAAKASSPSVAAPISRSSRTSSAAAASVAAAVVPSLASVNALRKLASSSRASVAARAAVRDGASLDGRKLRVAVIGGGPSGACAAETLAKGGVETFLIERKMDNCKVSFFLGVWDVGDARLERERGGNERTQGRELNQCLFPFFAGVAPRRASAML